MDICQRLFRLILGGLRTRPPSALPAPPGNIPVAEGPTRNGNNHSFNSDIKVEFRHNSAKAPSKDDLVSSDYDDDDEEEEEEEDRIKGKKSIGITGSERKTEVDHDDDDDHHHHHHLPVEDQLEDDTKVRRHWPLLSVESNINEKSEEYIERKKKAMIRNLSLDQDQKKKAIHDQDQKK